MSRSLTACQLGPQRYERACLCSLLRYACERWTLKRSLNRTDAFDVKCLCRIMRYWLWLDKLGDCSVNLIEAYYWQCSWTPTPTQGNSFGPAPTMWVWPGMGHSIHRALSEKDFWVEEAKGDAHEVLCYRLYAYLFNAWVIWVGKVVCMETCSEGQGVMTLYSGQGNAHPWITLPNPDWLLTKTDT